jgi:hypothetical protein
MRFHSAKVPTSNIMAGGFLLGVAAIFLICLPVRAQFAPANAVTVKLLDPIDSAQAQAGQRFHAAIAKDTAVGGVFLAKGADATITLVPGTGGNRWTLSLIEVTVNGKVVGVNGQNPVVVPTGAGDFLTMSKKTVTTRDRIAVAAGENVRFVLGPANSSPPPAAVTAAPSAPAPASPPAPGAGTSVDRSAQYRAMAVAGPKSAPDAVIGPAGAALFSRALKYQVRLDHCDRKATASSSCDFTYLNSGDEREIRVGTGAFVAVDSKGQTIAMTKQSLAGITGVGALAVPGLPGHVHFDYPGLDPDVTSLARVNIKIYEPPWNRWAEFEFRNVPLNAPPAPLEAFTPVPRPAPAAVVDQEGWRISVVRCSPLRRNIDPETQVVECFLKVENQKADRSIGLMRGTVVDEEGRVYFNSWYSSQNASVGGSPDRGVGFLGTEAVYSRVSAVPTKSTPFNGIILVTEVDSLGPTTVKYGEPHYAFAVFSKVPTDVTRIPQMVCTFESEPPGYPAHLMEFQFNDVPITPMPKLPSGK